MSENNDNPLTSFLSFVAGAAGALLGAAVGAEDPEINLFAGGVIGLIMGAIAGRIVGAVLSMVFQVLFSLIAVAIVVWRMGSILNFVSNI